MQDIDLEGTLQTNGSRIWPQYRYISDAQSISKEFAEPWKALEERRGHPARALAIVLSRRHTSLSLREIGEHCCGADYAAVSQVKHRMEAKLRDNKRLAAMAERIAKRLVMSDVET
jgi:hypothetical protein